jgi:hypothetical protein
MGRRYVLSAVVGSLSSLVMLTQFGWEVALLSMAIAAMGAGIFYLVDSH